MKTFNYSEFAFMPTNRGINNLLVKRLVKSIKEIGYVEARPVIVNQQMVIIDGQHRFLACQQLGLPIYYQVSDVDMSKAMINLNMNQTIWRLWDYVESWAESGFECYKELVNFRNKYKFTPSVCLSICVPSGGVGRSTSRIRSGKQLNINPNNEAVAVFLLNCKDELFFYNSSVFVKSVVFMFNKTTDEDRERLFNNIHKIKQQARFTDYLVIFENIINKGRRPNKWITL